MTGSFIHQFFIVGIMAMLFILAGKVLTTKYYIRGLSELFQAT